MEALRNKYVVFVERGNTQGSLSAEHSAAIINSLAAKGYNVFFNGNYKNIVSKLPAEVCARVIDGYTYPLREYPTIVQRSQFVVTVNTLIYHIAIQLEKPVVVISANEYESVKLDAENQEIVFDADLQEAYMNGTLESFHPLNARSLTEVETQRILDAIDKINVPIC